MSVDVDEPLPLLPGQCAICGALTVADCIPECDADELSDDDVTNIAVARLIERGAKAQR